MKKTALICIALCAVMLLSTVSGIPLSAEGATYDELQDSLEKAKAVYNAAVAERKNAQNRLSELEALIKDIDNKRYALEVQYAILEEKIAYIQKEQEITDSLIAAYTERQEYYSDLIEEQQAQLDEMLELYATVLRYSYEHGDTSTFAIIFNSSDFTQFLSRLQYFDNIIEYNDTIVGSLKKIEAEMTELQGQYDSALDNLTYYTEMLSDQQSEVAETQAAMDAIAAEYDLLYGEYLKSAEAEQDLIAEMKADEEILYQSIKDIENQILNYENNVSDFRWPLEVGVWYTVTSYYGWRVDPLGRGYKFHSGVDIAAGGGNKVLAVCDGVVTTAKYHNSYGNYVVIYHGDGVSTLYAHMQNGSLQVKVGDKVTKGQWIGRVGTTGDSTGNHLHFSVIVNGEYLNPDNYLPDGYYVKKYNKK